MRAAVQLRTSPCARMCVLHCTNRLWVPLWKPSTSLYAGASARGIRGHVCMVPELISVFSVLLITALFSVMSKVHACLQARGNRPRGIAVRHLRHRNRNSEVRCRACAPARYQFCSSPGAIASEEGESRTRETECSAALDAVVFYMPFTAL